ncbi:hypothetical protein [Acinetobacter baumannii]
MRNIIACCLLIYCPFVSAEIPFGLKAGMSLNEIKKFDAKPVELGDGNFIIKNVPKPYDGFKDYVVKVSPTIGLCKVVGWGKPVKTSVYGDGLSSEFDSVKSGLTTKYGAPNGDYNFLRAKSIWSQPNEWMMGLYKEERILAATWEPKDSDGVKNIMLKAKAKSTNEGYITVAYEFFNTESCYKEKKVKDISGL